MKNKTDTVWAVMCPAWGTVISLYAVSYTHLTLPTKRIV